MDIKVYFVLMHVQTVIYIIIHMWKIFEYKYCILYIIIIDPLFIYIKLLYTYLIELILLIVHRINNIYCVSIV